MAVLIDPPIWPARGRRWSHLVSDVSLAELHLFAGSIGIPDRGFEGDHYDVPEERYAGVVAAGAIPVSSRELLRRLQQSGLRRPKRRGERVLASRAEGRGGRLDTVLSTLAPLGEVLTVHVVVEDGGRLLVRGDGGEGYVLPSAPASGAGHGAWWDALRRLLGALVADASPVTHVVQAGYLRHVPATRRTSTTFEVVARWWPSGASQGQAHRSGEPGTSPAVALDGDATRWVAWDEAVPLLPREIAPLVEGTLFRVRGADGAGT